MPGLPIWRVFRRFRTLAPMCANPLNSYTRDNRSCYKELTFSRLFMIRFEWVVLPSHPDNQTVLCRWGVGPGGRPFFENTSV